MDFVRSKVPAHSRCKYGSEFSYKLCAATLCGRATQAVTERTNGDFIAAYGGEDDALAERLTDPRSALRYFAGVPRQFRRKTLH